MEKIERLKEATGNTDVGFSEQDIDDDFNPAEHDKRMQVFKCDLWDRNYRKWKLSRNYRKWKLSTSQ